MPMSFTRHSQEEASSPYVCSYRLLKDPKPELNASISLYKCFKMVKNPNEFLNEIINYPHQYIFIIIYRLMQVCSWIKFIVSKNT
jgi:hypothetical protein